MQPVAVAGTTVALALQLCWLLPVKAHCTDAFAVWHHTKHQPAWQPSVCGCVVQLVYCVLCCISSMCRGCWYTQALVSFYIAAATADRFRANPGATSTAGSPECASLPENRDSSIAALRVWWSGWKHLCHKLQAAIMGQQLEVALVAAEVLNNMHHIHEAAIW